MRATRPSTPMGSSRDPALPGPLGQQLIYMITLHRLHYLHEDT
jgi:hypothetical protein